MFARCAARLVVLPSVLVRQKVVRSRATWVVLAGSTTTASLFLRHNGIGWRTCHCEALVPVEHSLPSPTTVIKETSAALAESSSGSRYGFASRLYWTFRLMLRATRHWLTFAPLALLYPLLMWTGPTRRLWWSLAVTALQYSGPTLIKLGQWASTRRDLFSKELCEQFSVLQRHTGKRSWSKSQAVLDNTFGKGVWKQLFSNFDRHPIGSGCIAQVFKAQVNPKSFSRATGISLSELPSDECVTVAIKIAHPSVLHEIQMDLGIMRFMASVAERVAPNVRLLNPIECLSQFQFVLEQQVDLRHEGRALQRFGANFDQASTSVRFPVPLCYSRNVLVETYEPGVHVGQLVTDDVEDEMLKSPELKRRVALRGARALLKMIFVDNLVHGDLHPGNILIRFNDFGDSSSTVFSNERRHATVSEPIYKRVMTSIYRFLLTRESPGEMVFSESGSPSLDGDSKERLIEPTLVFIDAGITVEQTPKNLKNLHAVFKAIVQNKGEKVGELLLSQSPQHACEDPEKFKKEIGRIVNLARKESSLRNMNISSLLSQLFSTVSEHQVSLEPSFCCVVMSVMVLEGLGRSLDPNLDLFECAAPYLL